MKEHHIIIHKTARYYTLGELSQHTRHVWFVLHGFGQMAKTFLQNFEPLQNNQTLFIAPEALNHFYLKGAGGNVGATWMTKEDRLNEIKDYINYLNDLYEEFNLEQYPETNITALGFSQGASTVTRWVNATPHRIDNVIVYAGEVAPEVLPLTEHSPLRKTRNYFICGKADSIFTPAIVDKMKTSYTELNFEYTEFEGGHEIQPDTLSKHLPH
jgi:predicted esterase